jgi:predicted alpha/beta superfamily hydrolase
MRTITRILLCCFLAGICQQGLSQYKVRLVITGLPAYHPASAEIFVAGSFNGWNPGDARYQVTQLQGKPGIILELPKGMYEFKFTRGNWATAESGEKGVPFPNRRLQLESDTTISIDISHWADHFPSEPRKSTASRNVRVIDTAFIIPQLNRSRRVWIYLPEDYASSKKKYPVLYMHDGQNVFDAATSAYGEWGVDEALDSLGPSLGGVIVVAVDNSPTKRMNEYAPYDMEKFGKGEGDAYVDFLAKTLKPFIDRHYRTEKKKEHTFIAGSSMGGLISYYAILKYPKVFGGAGVFSPAFWINPAIKAPDPEKTKKVKGRIYFYAGQQESETMVSDMLAVFDHMLRHSKARMETVVRAEGRHNEPTWRAEFPAFIKWIMSK